MLNRLTGSSSVLGIFICGFCFRFCSSLRALGDSHHVISMRLSGPEDLIRHGYRKRRAPFKLSLRAPFGAFQIDASGWWVKPPSSGGCLINDNWAFWTSDGRHQCAFLRRKDPPVRSQY
jgi:hypothetical protein